MAKAGTRRTTIMNRRAGQRARLVYWGKRIGGGLFICALLFGGGLYAVTSGYVDQWQGRMTRAFHAQMVESGLRVSHVLVEGRQYTDKEALKFLVDIDKGQSIFEPDMNDLQQKLEKLTWVKSAVVERRLPNTIAIHIEERRPIALWQNRGKLFVIDDAGEVLATNNLDRFRSLLILVGDDAPQKAQQLVALINVEKDLKERMESAKWIGGRRWDLYLKNGVSVKLPEDDVGQAVRRLAFAQGEAGLMDRKIESIDLRDPDRIIVQTAPGAVEEYQAAYHPQKNI